jgi:putative transposase
MVNSKSFGVGGKKRRTSARRMRSPNKSASGNHLGQNDRHPPAEGDESPCSKVQLRRHDVAHLDKLRRVQRRVARRKKGSNRRRKAVALLQKTHARIWRLRNEFQHRQSYRLIRNGTIAIEDLNVKGLSGGMLAKSVHDVGWASFFDKIAYKAESAGRNLIKVDPSGTSQICLCGATVRKLLSDREHVCTECGLIAPRDLVSAQVILQRARISPSNHNVGLSGAMRGLRSRRASAGGEVTVFVPSIWVRGLQNGRGL